MPPTLWARVQAAIAAFRNRTPAPPPAPVLPDLAALRRDADQAKVALKVATEASNKVQAALSAIGNR